jgi:hypothetical protein
MKHWWLWIWLLLALPASAQERITLAEVIPALSGTELGDIDLGEAPAPGLSRVVSRSEVLAALRRVDRSAKGLLIPRATRIERVARRIEASELAALIAPALSEAISPCELGQLRALDAVSVPQGQLVVRAEGRAPARSGNVSAVVILESRGRALRLAVRATAVCPAPLVQSSSPVRIVAKIGNVVASAPGEAHQAGRLNDIVLVSRRTDGARIRARVVDRDTVEVFDP